MRTDELIGLLAQGAGAAPRGVVGRRLGAAMLLGLLAGVAIAFALADWLRAQGQNLSSVKDAWTSIRSVQDKMGPDADGKTVKITPKVWVEANAPVTTSVQHGCGRVMYTTYHTQPTSQTSGALEPQALALLYLILEVGVCIDPIVIG